MVNSLKKLTNHRGFRWGVAIALILLVFMLRPVYEAVENWWCGEYPSEVPANKVYDYGIVLGGYGDWDYGRNRPEFGPFADRLLEGIQLYRKGNIRKLIIASDRSNRVSKKAGEVIGNPEGMRAYIARLGVTPTDIILENSALTTRENAETVKKLIKASSNPTILLITSATHMPRALWTFRNEGITVDPYATDCIVSNPSKKNSWAPSIDVLSAWQSLFHEFIGSIYYRLRK